MVDHAEIPTLQQRPLLDSTLTACSASARPGAGRARSAPRWPRGVVVTVDGGALSWIGAGCRADAAAGGGRAADHPRRVPTRRPAALADAATVVVTDGYLADRIGWREITAVGDGVRLAGSELPAASVSHELRSYPSDLLTDPLDMRSATVQVQPGTGGGGTELQLPAVSTVEWLARPARRVVHRAGRTGRPDGRGRRAGGAAGHGARRLARHAARPRQDRDGGLPGWSTRNAARRAARRSDRHRDAHRGRAGAGAGGQRVRLGGA